MELPQVQVKRAREKRKQHELGGLIFTGAGSLRKSSKARKIFNNAMQPYPGAVGGPGDDGSHGGANGSSELFQMARTSLASKSISLNKSSKRSFVMAKNQHNGPSNPSAYPMGSGGPLFSDSDSSMPNLYSSVPGPLPGASSEARASQLYDLPKESPSPPLASASLVENASPQLTHSIRATSSGGRRLRASSKKQLDMIQRLHTDYNTGDEGKRRLAAHAPAPAHSSSGYKKKNIAALIDSQALLLGGGPSAPYGSTQGKVRHTTRPPQASSKDVLMSRSFL